MPLLQELSDRLLEAFGKSAHVDSVVREMMTENLAHALSYLEQAKPWITEADNLRHRALYLEFSNAIAKDLENSMEHLTTDAMPAWLSRLLHQWHDERCTVISLNYDTLVERFSSRLEFSNGARINAGDLYPLVLTDAGIRAGTPAPERRSETFRLLKLHGSTNWYYSGRTAAFGEPIYFVPPLSGSHVSEQERSQHEQRVLAVSDKYPFLVPPVYDKSPLLTHETIRALWFEAGEALKQAQRVICMGYSLPESDLTMMHFLRTTCAPGATIELVNDTRDALPNFERLFTESDVTIEQHGEGESSIAEFIDRLVGV